MVSVTLDRESLLTLESVLESMVGAVVVCDSDGRVNFANPAEVKDVLQRVAARARGVFEAPYQSEGESIRLTASLGAVLADEWDDVTTLLDRADRAMYEQKSAVTRNRARRDESARP